MVVEGAQVAASVGIQTFVHQLGNDGALDVVVKEKVFALSGVVVSAENAANKVRSAGMGIEKVRMDRVKNVPMVFGEADVVKIILTLPGVKSVGEAARREAQAGFLCYFFFPPIL